MIHNPYYDLWLEAQKYPFSWDMKQAMGVVREDLTMKYSWAVPDQAALDAIKNFVPDRVVEIGAGNGYWAYLLDQMGITITAYDIEPYKNQWLDGTRWGDVFRKDGLSAIRYEQEHNLFSKPFTLMMVWPYMNSMAFDALTAYTGDRLIYVGEGYGGCTASDEFFDLLSEKWTRVAKLFIPQWRTIHDCLYLYERGV